jgi:ketosteroid isomerase-like protein
MKPTITKKEIMKYFDVFNSADYERAVSSYYSEDIIFESPNDKFVGRESILRVFIDAHAGGIKEILTPTNILIDGDNVAMQLDVKFTFPLDVPNFHLGPAKKGDSFSSKIAVFYKINNGKITHITLYEFGSPIISHLK